MAKKKKTKKKHRKLPDLLILKQEFIYDPITGALTDEMTGDDVTKVDSQGYRTVYFKGVTWKAHRICFYMFHKRDPGKKVIDHIDGNRSNNSIFNLRACSHRDNVLNTKARRDKGIVPKAEPGSHFALV